MFSVIREISSFFIWGDSQSIIYIFSDLKLSYNCILYGYSIFPFIIYGIRPVLKKFFKGVKIYFTLAGVFKVSKGGVGAIQRIV